MKKTVYLLFFLMGSLVANAQYYHVPYPNAGQNPGNLNADGEYPVGGGLPAGWVTILGGNNTSPAWSPSQTIPFPFSFNGGAVSAFKVSSSGVLTFAVNNALPAPSSTQAALPSASIPDSSVCIWGMYGAGGNDNIITKVFGTAPNRQLWVQFSSYGYGSTISDGSNFTYWSIVLEETTNNIHIVDNRTGGFAGVAKVSLGVQIDGTTANSVAGSPNVAALAGTDGTPADNTYYTFIQGVQPAYDLAVSSNTTGPYVGVGANNITGVIKNFGTTTITSFALNYTIDGGATVTSNITGVNIPTNGTYSFTHPTSWAATAGAHVVDVWATNLNGSNADQVPANDHKSITVSVLGEIVQRLPFLEVFTSSTCAPCTPGNANFLAIMDTIARKDYVAVKYQQDFPGTGDPYRTAETVNRRNTPYAINSIPRMEIDGGWDGNAVSYTYQLYTESRQLPAFYKLEGEYSRNNKQYDMKVRFSPLVEATGERLYIAIIEHRTDRNVKTNGETEFFDVMKKMVPTDAGTNLPSTAVGSWDSLSFTYTFQGNYRLPANGQAASIIDHTIENSVENFYNTSVVAWVQTPNKQVMQAARLTTTQNTGGLTDLGLNVAEVVVFPNPANDNMKVTFKSEKAEEIVYVIVDGLGNTVISGATQSNVGVNTLDFNTSSLATGMYHLMLFDSNNNAHIEKIIVQH